MRPVCIMCVLCCLVALEPTVDGARVGGGQRACRGCGHGGKRDRLHLVFSGSDDKILKLHFGDCVLARMTFSFSLQLCMGTEKSEAVFFIHYY